VADDQLEALSSITRRPPDVRKILARGMIRRSLTWLRLESARSEDHSSRMNESSFAGPFIRIVLQRLRPEEIRHSHHRELQCCRPECVGSGLPACGLDFQTSFRLQEGFTTVTPKCIDVTLGRCGGEKLARTRNVCTVYPCVADLRSKSSQYWGLRLRR
jgi:hypothetical protein